MIWTEVVYANACQCMPIAYLCTYFKFRLILFWQCNIILFKVLGCSKTVIVMETLCIYRHCFPWNRRHLPKGVLGLRNSYWGRGWLLNSCWSTWTSFKMSGRTRNWNVSKILWTVITMIFFIYFNTIFNYKNTCLLVSSVVCIKIG